MPKREAFLIRIDPDTLDRVRRWAEDELRSVNAQIEFILGRALDDAGRSRRKERRDRREGREPSP